MSTYFGPVPPPIPYASRPPPHQYRRPSQPAVDASISALTRKNAVYYPNWHAERGDTPATLNYNCINHVFYAFATLNPDGNIELNDWLDLQMPVDGVNGCLGSFVRLKQQHDYLKVILSIGGENASENFASVAASAAKRDTFGQSAKRIVVEGGVFDGIDIDWEHPQDPQQGADFLTLLASIRIYLPDDRYFLSAALPAGEWCLRNIDLYRAQDYLDVINLMAYDFHGSWSQTSGYHAQLYPSNPNEPSGSAAVNYVLSQGFPAQKILLGVPIYGPSFLGARGPGEAFRGSGGPGGTFEYKVLPRDGAEEIVNKNNVSAFCVGGDGGFVSYDNPITVQAKAEFCRDKGLGGLFYWTGTGDAPPGPRSLVSAGFKALHGG